MGTTYDMPYEQGTGIHSVGSTFTVANDCNVLVPLGTPCPAPNTTASSFTNLHYGIVATTVDPGRTFSVSDATFTGTNFGIRMEGIQDAAMHRNTFNVPQPVIPGILGAVYGVYSDQCTGYSIQENTFHTTQPTGLNRKVGLIIKDSGTQYNTFYNNTFNNLYTGSLVQGKNATMNGAVGLEIKCNDYGMAQKNSYDVGLTGSHVYIQNKQGSVVFDPNDPAELQNPAGNRFSLLHNGGFSLEEDWYVQNTSTFTEYFHHTATFGNRTRPDYHDLNWLLPSDQNAPWPVNRALACPSRLEDGGHEVKREAAEQEHAEYGDSKAAYDATKDDGDTYTLLGYVGDPGHSSTQVRNALQSVAPKVSAEVWQTAFERNPTLNAWHITQALLSNSPLQGEVLKMVEFYALPSAYADLVYAAQSGEVNILSLLEGAMARHNGAKAEALSDLGRMAWLDSLQLSASLDSLVWLHDALPSDNQALTRSGVLAAKGEYTALEALTQAEATASETPELYDVLKHYASVQQNNSWDDTTAVDVIWLTQVAAQRDVVGSAQANAWLHALGHDLPEEIIILPEEGPKSMGQPRRSTIHWETGATLEVFPNPSSGPVFAVVEVPEGMDRAELVLLDLHGRQLHGEVLGTGPGVVQLTTSGLATGIYVAELRIDGHALAQAKVAVQR